MIGPVLFDISYEIYLTMLGLIWMLMDSVYHIIRPLERSGENISDKLIEKCDKNKQLILKSNELVDEKLQENSIESDSSLLFEMCKDEGLRVNIDIITLSEKNNFFGATNASIEREILLKRSHVSPKIVYSNHQKPLNLMVVKNYFNKKNELSKNLLFSIREITKFINKSTIANEKQTPVIPLSQNENGRDITFSFPVPHLEAGIDIKIKKSNWSSFRQSETTHGKCIKLDNDQILALQETAHYIIKHFDIGFKSHFRNKFHELDTVDYFCTNWNYSSSKINNIDVEKTSNVIITELDSGDEIELKKHKNQRKKKNKKRYRKGKLISHKIETNSITFSSKQCFEKLVYFMSTNQGLTQSKMMLEIEKEFKPIKDQISELRESMTDFVVVNQRTYENRIKSSKLYVKPIDRRHQRLRNIFTVSSASLQKLARLADTSTNIQENSCHQGTDDEPKKLSPLAEMYIKLSRK